MRSRRSLAVAFACAAGLLISGLVAGMPAVAASASGTPRPVVSLLSVTSGPVAGGTRVQITGKYFTSVSKVIFGAQIGTSLKVASSTEILVTSPAHTAGTVNVQVVAMAGTSDPVAVDRFTYEPLPKITSLTPNQGSIEGGTRVKITGTSFLGVSKVLFGSAPGTGLHVASSTTIMVTAPAGTALGESRVRVVGAYGESAAAVPGNSYTYVVPAEALTWGSPQQAVAGGITGSIGCLTATDCFALDTGGGALTWNGSAWSRAQGGIPQFMAGTGAASCPTAQFCVIPAGEGKALVYSSGTWATESLPNSTFLDSVSCVSSSFCMGATSFGTTLTYDGANWTQSGTLGSAGSGYSISCASTSFCVAGLSAGEILTWNGSLWSQAVSLASSSWAPLVSCPSATWCRVIDSSGDVYAFDGTTWSPAGTDGLTAVPTDLACTSPTFCMASSRSAQFARYDGASWTVTSTVFSVDSASRIPQVACSGTTCIGTLGAPVSLASVYSGGSWGAAAAIDLDNGLSAVSCVAGGFCAAVGNGEDAVTRSAAGTWSPPQHLAGAQSPDSVSCASASFCLAADNDAHLWSYANGSWASMPGPVGAPVGITQVSCPSATFCALSDAAQSGGGLATFNGSTWTSLTPVVANAVWIDVSCASSSFCGALDSAGNVSIFNGTTWSAPMIVTGGLSTTEPGALPVAPISCPVANFCAITDGGDYAYTFNGTSWTGKLAYHGHDTTNLTGLSCATSTFCIANDSFSFYSYDGNYWSYGAGSGITPMAESCLSPTWCLAVGAFGQVSTGV